MKEYSVFDTFCGFKIQILNKVVKVQGYLWNQVML